MASHDSPAPTYETMKTQRVKSIVEAQLDHSVPHPYVVPVARTLPAGTGSVIFDADGLIIGAAADLPYGANPESISYQLQHPQEPEPEEEEVATPLRPLTPDGRAVFEAQRWNEMSKREVKKDPTTIGYKLRQTLKRRRDYVRKTPSDSKMGRPRKYDDRGRDLRYVPRTEEAKTP